MIERLGTAGVGLLCIILALGFVALRDDLRVRGRQIYLTYFGEDYRPGLFILIAVALFFLALGAFLIARAIRGETL